MAALDLEPPPFSLSYYYFYYGQLSVLLSAHTPTLFSSVGLLHHSHIHNSLIPPHPRCVMSFIQIFLCSAFAASFAEFCTIPLDVAKVRMQLQKKVPTNEGTPKYRGLLGTVATIAREEGLSALWNGIIPGLHRQCIYGGLRIGLYGPVKSFLGGSDSAYDTSLFQSVLAALLTGAIAIAVANPTDLVKIRLQAEGKLLAGVSGRYAGALNAYATIVNQEGLGALWTGLGPNIARNAVINAAELASYDQVKMDLWTMY